jgi:acyl carrier protein
MDDVEKKVIKIISKIINDEDINDKSVQYMYHEWDSLAYLSIAMEIEKQFSIEIDENNFNEFGSVKQIVQIIKSNAN